MRGIFSAAALCAVLTVAGPVTAEEPADALVLGEITEGKVFDCSEVENMTEFFTNPNPVPPGIFSMIVQHTNACRWAAGKFIPERVMGVRTLAWGPRIALIEYRLPGRRKQHVGIVFNKTFSERPPGRPFPPGEYL